MQIPILEKNMEGWGGGELGNEGKIGGKGERNGSEEGGKKEQRWIYY